MRRSWWYVLVGAGLLVAGQAGPADAAAGAPTAPGAAIVYLEGTPGAFACGSGEAHSIAYLTPGATAPRYIYQSSDNCNIYTRAELSPDRTEVATISGGDLGFWHIPDLWRCSRLDR